MNGEPFLNSSKDNSNKKTDDNPLKIHLEKQIANMKEKIQQRLNNLERLKIYRNELNFKVKTLQEEIEEIENNPPMLVGSFIKMADNDRALIALEEYTKLLVLVNESIDVNSIKRNDRVILCPHSQEIVGILPAAENLRMKAMILEHLPDVTYDMIGGLDKQIAEIREYIEMPLKHPELFERLGVEQPKGAMLCGPPGTGKTMLARAVAHHTRCTFVRVCGTDFVQKYIGEGAKLIRDLFRLAKNHAPSIIFLDEIDSIGSTRGRDCEEVNRTMMELLSNLDGFDSINNVKIIMATNHMETLDPALMRSGRIDKRIEFDLPTEKGIEQIFATHSKKMNLAKGIDFRKLSLNLHRVSGAEVKCVCTEAGMLAIRDRRNHVTNEDFQVAIEKVTKDKNKFSKLANISLDKMWK